MAAREQIIGMLVEGVPGRAIASALGVSEPYVSPVAAEEDVQQLVHSKHLEVQAADQAYDSKLERIEDGFLDRIEDKAKFANLQQSLQAFRVLNGARRRKETRNGGVAQAGLGTVVNITLPISVVPHFIMNSASEIVEVQGKTMIAATVREIDSAIQRKLPSPSQEARGEVAVQQLVNRPTRRAVHNATGQELQDLL